MKKFILKLLRSRRKKLMMKIKDWFKAYINMGLFRYMQGRDRPIPCNAGTDSFFVDPWGKVIACNGSEEPWVMGDLSAQDFDEIWHSEQADSVRELVRDCKRNCWMTGTSVPAMRRKFWLPFSWVVRNKIRILMGKKIVLDQDL